MVYVLNLSILYSQIWIPPHLICTIFTNIIHLSNHLPKTNNSYNPKPNNPILYLKFTNVYYVYYDMFDQKQ